jgi:multidrug efflux system outer membrane protein
LVDAAVRANTDLEAARARVSEADARARQAGAAILPSVDANGTANYLAGHSSPGGGHELDWSAWLSASYEVYFWGKNRATAESARERIQMGALIKYPPRRFVETRRRRSARYLPG